MVKSSRAFPRVSSLFGSLLFVMAGAAPAATPATLPSITLLPSTPGNLETRSMPFITSPHDLEGEGYVEEEYLIAGKANIYGYANDAEKKPDVEALKTDTDYVTRILVRRPAYKNKFNGSVLVEVLNATAGWDGDPIWYGSHETLARHGFAWVGVSTKPVTVNFLRDLWGKDPRPVRNASRYATLSMPAFGQVWDMLTQVGQLLKSENPTENPLKGFDVRRLIMVGYSQSAGYEITYANSFHGRSVMADGRPIYDGYFIAAGGSRAKHVTADTPATESLPANDPRNLIRVNVPVVRYQTQTEVAGFGANQVRQKDEEYPLLRTYEVAGTSHVDAYRDSQSSLALRRDLGLEDSFCPKPALPYNPVNSGLYEAATLLMLDAWIRDGRKPPASRFMSLANNEGTIKLARDALGNVIGGVRPPELEAPLGSYMESNAGEGFCTLFGGFKPFKTDTLKGLYPSANIYVRSFTTAARTLATEGFLDKFDAERLILSARRNGTAASAGIN
jgi:hypothetical protein